MLTVWESDSLRCTGKSADAILPPFMKLDPSYQALASDFLATHRSTLHEDRLEVELIRIQHISANVASLANKRVLDLVCRLLLEKKKTAAQAVHPLRAVAGERAQQRVPARCARRRLHG